VGGNTLSFARYFEAVQASECHEGRLSMLKNNCKTAGANSQERAIQEARALCFAAA
jgi:hypothetical protein